jgi:hypothetical protein
MVRDQAGDEVVSIFPNEDAIVRLIGAILLEYFLDACRRDRTGLRLLFYGPGISS